MSDDAQLAAAQERLVAALIAGGELPPGFDPQRARATAAVLLGKRRNAVRRAVPRIPRMLGVDFGARFDEYARGNPLFENRSVLADAIGFLGWLRRNRALPAELRFLALKLRWKRALR